MQNKNTFDTHHCVAWISSYKLKSFIEQCATPTTFQTSPYNSFVYCYYNMLFILFLFIL